MFPLRLYITGIWLVSGALVIGGNYAVASLSLKSRLLNSDHIFIWGFVWIGATLVLMVASLGERDTWTFRVRRTIPRSRILRLLAFVTYSGSAGGLLWSCLLTAATFLILFSWIDWNPTISSWGVVYFLDMSITAGFILCYCLTAVLLRMTLLRNARTILLPMVALLFGVSVAIIPFLVVFFMDTRMKDPSPMTLMASPLGLTIPNMRDDVIAWAIPLLSVWTPTALLLSLPWFFKQWREFTRHEASRGADREIAYSSAISLTSADHAQPSAVGAEGPIT